MRRVFLCFLLFAAPAFAEDPKRDPEAGTPDAVPAPNTEGDYGGVQPGQGKKPEAKKKKPPPKGTLSWLGFETKNGGSDVFFQSVAPFQVSQRIDGGAVVVTLSGLTRLGHNTWRPIDTRFFETSIARVVAKKKGKNIEARITFKNPKDAAQGSVKTSTEADGFYYAYLSFSGTGTPTAKATPKEPEK